LKIKNGEKNEFGRGVRNKSKRGMILGEVITSLGNRYTASTELPWSRYPWAKAKPTFPISFVK
jgi:hypothetical protein